MTTIDLCAGDPKAYLSFILQGRRERRCVTHSITSKDKNDGPYSRTANSG
jgi:hypothetical protein